MKKTILTLTIIALSTTLSAQENKTCVKHHSKNEIGFANSLIHLSKSNTFCYGFHVHYLRNIFNSNFGLGIGYERVFSQHQHNGISLVAEYSAFEHFKISLSPGIIIEDENPKDLNFAAHIEASYEFELKSFCFGPVLECAYDKEDVHLGLGVHLGFEF